MWTPATLEKALTDVLLDYDKGELGIVRVSPDDYADYLAYFKVNDLPIPELHNLLVSTETLPPGVFTVDVTYTERITCAVPDET